MVVMAAQLGPPVPVLERPVAVVALVVVEVAAAVCRGGYMVCWIGCHRSLGA